MSISIGATVSGVVKIPDVQVATPADRETDDALAAQDSATETLSQGIARHRSGLDRLLDQPSVLTRFDR